MNNRKDFLGKKPFFGFLDISKDLADQASIAGNRFAEYIVVHVFGMEIHKGYFDSRQTDFMSIRHEVIFFRYGRIRRKIFFDKDF